MHHDEVHILLHFIFAESFWSKVSLSICTVYPSVFVELVSKLLFLPLDYLSSKLSAHQIIVSDKVRFDLVRKFPITDNSLCLEHCIWLSVYAALMPMIISSTRRIPSLVIMIDDRCNLCNLVDDLCIKS